MTDRTRKRVLVITHAGGSPWHGPNMRWYYLGEALKPLGVDVEIVSSSSFHKYITPPDTTEPYQTEQVGSLTYHWLRTRPYTSRGLSQVRNQAEFVFSCYRHIGRLRERRPDVVVASSPHPFVVYPAVSIAKQCDAAFFYETRDLWPAILLELGSFRPWHPYIVALRRAERYAVRHATRILSVKPGDYEYFADEYGLREQQFVYLPNGFLPGETDAGVPDAITQLRSRYPILLGYVGGVSAYYGLEDMVELARRFASDARVGFVVVGKGDRAEAISALVKSAGITNFHLAGVVEKALVPAVLNALDICYVGLRDLAIHRYGISCNKIYEYMFAAKPILGSYRAGYDPVGEAGCGFVVPPGDYESLAAKLRILVEDPTLRETLGRKGRTYFDEHHDFEKVAVKAREILFQTRRGGTEARGQ